MKPVSIMIVDDNADYRDQLRHAFEDRGYLTWTCPGHEIAESIFAAIQPNIVVLDLDLGETNPLDLIDAWREMAPGTRILVELTVPDVHRLRQALDHGAHAFVIKTHSFAPLFDLLEKEILAPSASFAPAHEPTKGVAV